MPEYIVPNAPAIAIRPFGVRVPTTMSLREIEERLDLLKLAANSFPPSSTAAENKLMLR